jgi:hypothetical protein
MSYFQVLGPKKLHRKVYKQETDSTSLWHNKHIQVNFSKAEYLRIQINISLAIG